ncbi:hypothetical protein CDT91_21765, partial [Cronobacter sakazakii]
RARDVVGRLHYHALGLEAWLAGQQAPYARFDATQLSRWLRPRRPGPHKRATRHLALIGGDHGTRPLHPPPPPPPPTPPPT